jgi:hypothetical protein
MEKFPEIDLNEVALVRVDSKTGHVLDENFCLCLSESQKVYTVFGSEEEAMSYINRKKMEIPNIDYSLYNNENKLIKRLLG